MTLLNKINETAAFLKEKGIEAPEFGLILGSGLGELAEEIDKDMSDLAEQLLEDYKQDRDIDAIRMYELPEQKAIKEIIRELMMVLLPGYYREKSYRTYSVDKKILVILEDVMFMMN